MIGARTEVCGVIESGEPNDRMVVGVPGTLTGMGSSTRFVSDRFSARATVKAKTCNGELFACGQMAGHCVAAALAYYVAR